MCRGWVLLLLSYCSVSPCAVLTLRGASVLCVVQHMLGLLVGLFLCCCSLRNVCLHSHLYSWYCGLSF